MSNTAEHQLINRQQTATTSVLMPLRLTTIVTSLILTLLPLLTGCADSTSGTSSGLGLPSSSTASTSTATASLAWDPVQDPTVTAYYVHYGRQSPGQPGSCAYENSMQVSSTSATVTIQTNTQYYFAVSAYNGLEGACSDEVTTIKQSNITLASS